MIEWADVIPAGWEYRDYVHAWRLDAHGVTVATCGKSLYDMPSIIPSDPEARAKVQAVIDAVQAAKRAELERRRADFLSETARLQERANKAVLG